MYKYCGATVAPSRMLENVDEATCLAPWTNAEVELAGRTLLYIQSRTNVSRSSRTISMMAIKGYLPRRRLVCTLPKDVYLIEKWCIFCRMIQGRKSSKVASVEIGFARKGDRWREPNRVLPIREQ